MMPQITVNKMAFPDEAYENLLHNLYDAIDGDDNNYIMMKMKKKE